MPPLSLAVAFVLALTCASPVQAEESSTRPITGAWIGQMPIEPGLVTMQVNLDEALEDKTAGRVEFCGPFIYCSLGITFAERRGDSFVFRIHHANGPYCAEQEGREFSLAPNRADEWFFKMEECGGRKVTVRLFRQQTDQTCSPGQGTESRGSAPLGQRLHIFRQP